MILKTCGFSDLIILNALELMNFLDFHIHFQILESNSELSELIQLTFLVG